MADKSKCCCNFDKHVEKRHEYMQQVPSLYAADSRSDGDNKDTLMRVVLAL